MAKFCDSCNKDVFVVKTKAQFSLAVSLGRCVGIADDNDFIGVIGDTAGSMDWLEPDHFVRVYVRAKVDLTFDQLVTAKWLMPMLFEKLDEVTALKDWTVVGEFEREAAGELLKNFGQFELPLEMRDEPI